MKPSDKPTQRGRHGVTFRYGVWVSPAGVRSEVVRDGDIWHVYAYRSPSDHRPQHVAEYSDQAELFRVIARLEAQGYRYVPDRRRHEPIISDPVAERPWKGLRIVIATAAVCIALIAIEIVLLKR